MVQLTRSHWKIHRKDHLGQLFGRVFYKDREALQQVISDAIYFTALEVLDYTLGKQLSAIFYIYQFHVTAER